MILSWYMYRIFKYWFQLIFYFFIFLLVFTGFQLIRTCSTVRFSIRLFVFQTIAFSICCLIWLTHIFVHTQYVSWRSTEIESFFASSPMFSVPGQQVVHTLHPSSISTAVPVPEATSRCLFFRCLCGQIEKKVKCLRKRLRKMSNS